MVARVVQPFMTFNDANGNPLAGGKLNFFFSKTVDTRKDTFTDETLSTPNTNPIVLDADGRPTVDVWGSAEYKLVIADSADVVQPNGTFDPVIGGNLLRSFVFVSEFGASGDGTNQTTQIQAAIDSLAGTIYFDNGNYVSDELDISANPLVKLIAESKDTIINATGIALPGVWLDCDPAGTGDVFGPTVDGFTINCINGIRVNNLATILDGTPGDAAVKQAVIINNSFVGDGTGVAIETSRLFDSQISNNDISGFDICVLLHGSDINEVMKNRIREYETYGILVQSAQTFGSQNKIWNNDIVRPANVAAIAIKSTDQHGSIVDNYIEIAASAGTNMDGMIDISSIGAPTYGSNVITLPFTIEILRNRFDGQSFCNTFVERIDASNATSIHIENRVSSGQTGPGSFFVESGSQTDYLDTWFNTNLRKYVTIDDATFGPDWHGTRTTDNVSAGVEGFTLNANNTKSLSNKDQSINFRRRGQSLVIVAAESTGSLLHVIPKLDAADSKSYFLPTGVDQIAAVIARTTSSSGDTLQFAKFGDALQSFTLTEQDQTFEVNHTGTTLATTNSGLFFSRETTNNGNIEIRIISNRKNTLDPTSFPTIVLTFATPGTSSMSFTVNRANVWKVGRVVHAKFEATGTLTVGTASGDLLIQMLTETPSGGVNQRFAGTCAFQGITKAGYTHVNSEVTGAGTDIKLIASGSAVASSTIKAADISGSISLKGYIVYNT